jgi:hypothetical protein
VHRVSIYNSHRPAKQWKFIKKIILPCLLGRFLIPGSLKVEKRLHMYTYTGARNGGKDKEMNNYWTCHVRLKMHVGDKPTHQDTSMATGLCTNLHALYGIRDKASDVQAPISETSQTTITVLSTLASTTRRLYAIDDECRYPYYISWYRKIRSIRKRRAFEFHATTAPKSVSQMLL